MNEGKNRPGETGKTTAAATPVRMAELAPRCWLWIWKVGWQQLGALFSMQKQQASMMKQSYESHLVRELPVVKATSTDEDLLRNICPFDDAKE